MKNAGIRRLNATVSIVARAVEIEESLVSFVEPVAGIQFWRPLRRGAEAAARVMALLQRIMNKDRTF